MKPKTPAELRDLATKARRLALLSHDVDIAVALLATARDYEREAEALERQQRRH